ncbi:MAG TPA: hypothetical protein VEY06_12445 [Flavisolibacter sp.]|nr:hypothetical protein [Flavisolibacter sp.]
MRIMHSPRPSFFDRSCYSIGSLVLPLFFFGCAPMAKMPATFSAYEFRDGPSAEKRQYLVMKDSSLVYGKKVSGWAQGLIGNKGVAHIDGRQVPVSEVLAIQNDEGYWIKLWDNTAAKRLVSGRISVYRSQYNPPRPMLVFFQNGNGPLRQLGGREELKQMLRDCSKAYDLLNISDDEYLKTMRKQRYFLNTVIETYNNCGELK